MKTGLLMGRVLAQMTDLQTPVRILNPSPTPVKLYKGMHVRTLHPIEYVETIR